MSTQPTQSAGADAPPFTPVPVRPRHDGWTPERQMGFIAALAATGCITQAAASVGMSARTAYDLYNRTDAASFRAAWDAALRHLTGQLATAMTSRALHGTATPIFYKGEQVGERRTFDNRLGMWMLARLNPSRYGAWQDSYTFQQANPDAPASNFHIALRDLASDLAADTAGEARPKREPRTPRRFDDAPEAQEERARARAKLDEMESRIANQLFRKRLELIGRGEIDPNDPGSYTAWEARERQACAEQYRALEQQGIDPASVDDAA